MITEEQKRLFDNEFYLDKYPDVAIAIKDGLFKTGFDHFASYGRVEKRDHRFKTEAEMAIDNVNYGWSKHLTLDGKEPIERDRDVLNAVDVPSEFKPIQQTEYPEGNKLPFERYFNNKFDELIPNTLRTYLPIHWTAYYVNNGYGTSITAIDKLQEFIDSLDKSKKYFTVYQYDDKIINNVSNLDLLVYASGCYNPGYYPIPLISQPLNNSPSEYAPKTHLYSFYGANTHPIRESMVNGLNDKNVSFKSLKIDEYYNVLKDSTFALCPRGYGATSFRMYEAMHYGCIPVYISDMFIEPFNIPLTEYAVKIYPEQIKDIERILKEVNTEALIANSKHIYENFFVYSSCFNAIIKTLL